MSRNGLIVVIVIAVAIVVSAYYTFAHGSSNTTKPTPTSAVATTIPSSDLATRGAALFTQFRCSVCHTTTGERGAGPTLKGLYGSKVTLNTGQTITADEGYLAESITNPDNQIVAGYGPSVMSAALDDISTNLHKDDNIAALVAYIESLK